MKKTFCALLALSVFICAGFAPLNAGAAAGQKQPLWSLKAINSEIKQYGSMTIEGMKGADYDKAMSIPWKLVNKTGKPQNIVIDLRTLMNYTYVQKVLFNLDKYNGVSLYDIGDSAKKRNIYMLDINLQGKNGDKDKPIVLITGNVHAMEFAGCDFALKFANDTVKRAQTDDNTRRLLESVRFVIVPLVNPDGRELEISGQSRKSNANGVDLNRNMPALNAGQLAKGVSLNKEIAKKPGSGYYPGKNLGSESESQAMIKFLTTWIADKRTVLYVDLHQSGQFEYYNKNFLSQAGDNRAKSYAQKNNRLLNSGYPLRSESATYGIDGVGGTLTDFARSVAEGMVFSYKYGRLVMDIGGKETPLVSFRDVDRRLKYLKPLNKNFVAITPEIGPSGSSGATSADRKARYNTYIKYNWKSFLTGTAQNVLALKQAAS